MDIETFLNMPTSEIAALVRERGPGVCVFPINGTRRWFILEHPQMATGDFVGSYLEMSGRRHLELYRLFFEHGVHTLLTPIVGPDILERDGAYQHLLEQGLRWFAENDEFLAFYDAYGVSVRIYGDAERYLSGTAYATALNAYTDLAERTKAHGDHRLFFGICAHDATESVAEIGVRFYKDHGRVPTRREIIERYYGEYVEPVDLFLGFDRPAAFDMPLIATGSEALYFTIAPSPYLDPKTLRLILYDHIFARGVDDNRYDDLAPETWRALADFYRRNQHHVLGIGRKHSSGSFWYPIPQVDLPSALQLEASKLLQVSSSAPDAALHSETGSLEN